MTFLTEPFRLPLHCQRVLIQTLGDELRKRHAGSVFGVAWLLLTPLLFLALYAATFIWIFKVKPTAMSLPEYILFLFCGLMSFLAFSEGLSAGVSAVTVNRSIILNNVFPAELLPLRTVLATQTLLAVGIAISAIMATAMGRASPLLLLTPAVIVLQVMFVTGVSCFLAPVAVFFKDLSEIIRFAVMTLMIVSPIAWLPEEAPGVLSIFLYANPVSYYIISFQDLIVFQRLPGTGTAITIAVQSVLMYLLGFWFIRRLKQMVSDYA